MFKKLRLYTQILMMLFAIGAMCIINLYLIVNAAMNNFVDRQNQQIISDISHAISSYADSEARRIGLLGISNSHWEDLVRATERKDSEWIRKYATKYMLDQASYKVDFIYVENRLKGYRHLDGYFKNKHIEELKEVFAQSDLKTGYDSRIVRIGHKLYAVSASSLSDDDMVRHSGIFIIGTELDKGSFASVLKNYASQGRISVEVKPGLTDDMSVYPSNLSPASIENVIDVGVVNDGLIAETLRSKRVFVFCVSIITLQAIAVILLFLYTVSARIEDMVSSIKRISYKDYREKLSPSFSKEFTELSECVNELSIGLEKRDEDLRRSYVEIISILIKSLEEVDMYTRGHSERVAHYACGLARRVGYHDIDLVNISGLLHDFGKITIDINVLNKPGTLTADEYDLIKEHPERAYKILDTSGVFEMIKDIVRHHHERYDGRGYPLGISGKEIPYASRIIAIADVFDALTSERSYRKAMSVHEAVEILKEGRGTQFDPDLLDAFIPIAKEIYDEGSVLGSSDGYEELIYFASLGKEGAIGGKLAHRHRIENVNEDSIEDSEVS